MHNNFRNLCRVCHCAAALFLLHSPMSNAQEQQPTVSETIVHLIEAEEFKAPEQELLQSLPIESVSILAGKLSAIAPNEPHSRQFYLLAAKVSQFESAMSNSQLSQAVDALLSRLKVEPGAADADIVLLRLKMEKVVTIRDHRIVAAVKAARATLGETESPQEPQASKIENSGAQLIPARSASPQRPGEAKSQPAPTPSEEPALSKLWSLIVLLIVAALGLLWVLLKKRK